MASSTYHSINISGDGIVRREALADAAITPGELLEINADEEAAPHSGSAGVLPGVLVALEDPTAAAGTTEAIDVDYDAGDTVYYAVGRPGEVYYMFLAASQTVVRGVTQLQSDGAGAVTPVTVDATTLEKSVVGIADEDLTAGVSRARLRVMIT